MKLIRSLFIFLIIITAIGFLAVYVYSNRFYELPAIKKPTDIDAYTTQSRTLNFNQAGQLSDILVAKYTEHFKQDDTVNLTNPVLTSFTPNRPTWHIHAQYGRVINNQHKIILWGDVVLHRPPQKNSTEATILTQHLIYFQQKKIAISNTHTIAAEPGSTLSGDDCTVNMNTNTIVIRHNTRSSISPTSRDRNTK